MRARLLKALGALSTVAGIASAIDWLRRIDFVVGKIQAFPLRPEHWPPWAWTTMSALGFGSEWLPLALLVVGPLLFVLGSRADAQAKADLARVEAAGARAFTECNTLLREKGDSRSARGAVADLYTTINSMESRLDKRVHFYGFLLRVGLDLACGGIESGTPEGLKLAVNEVVEANKARLELTEEIRRLTTWRGLVPRRVFSVLAVRSEARRKARATSRARP